MTYQTANWREYPPPNDPDEHSVVGTVLTLPLFHSPQLDNHRSIVVYLPPSYSQGERRYPVLYMQDGQNLFDRATGFAGQEWQVDETMENLSVEGLEAIVVGVPHMDKDRITEYNPFPNARWKGNGDKYLDFLVNTLKPVIDRDFRTLPDHVHTGIMGSSMGGLISLYGFFRRPDVFGFAGVMSPALWISGGAIYPFVQNAPYNPGRIYLDNGTKEGSAARMNDLLIRKGYIPGRTLMYVKEAGGEHTESAWARRLPDALRFLLKAYG